MATVPIMGSKLSEYSLYNVLEAHDSTYGYGSEYALGIHDIYIVLAQCTQTDQNYMKAVYAKV